MIRRVPMRAWETALYGVLTKHITGYNIYNTVDPCDEEQYVSIGAYTCTITAAKSSIYEFDVTSTLHCYLLGQDKQKLNDMFDDVVLTVTAGQALGEYGMEGFALVDVGISMIECFDEETESGEIWQHGVVRVAATIQQN